MEQQKKKRTGLVIALIACLALVGVGGVMAWYNAQSSITNNFTAGNIKDPENRPDETDPTKPGKDPIVPETDDQGKVNGNIYEKNWVDGSKVTAGATVVKDPNIGLGKGSDNAYVFVHVKNELDAANTYFTLENGWKAVDSAANSYTAVPNAYTGGLFVYVGSGTAPALLNANPNTDSWTGPLFTNVHANDQFTPKAGSIKVSSYLVAASNASETIDVAEITNSAIEWAAKL